MNMKLHLKIVLCVALALFAAASLAAVLGGLGAVPASAEEECYLLRDSGGYVGIFCPVDAEEPSERTDIRVAGLPAEDQQMLRDGVCVSGREALARLLEDYGA